MIAADEESISSMRLALKIFNSKFNKKYFHAKTFNQKKRLMNSGDYYIKLYYIILLKLMTNKVLENYQHRII